MFYITNTPIIPHSTEILYVSMCVCEGEEGTVRDSRISGLVYASTIRWRSTGTVNGWFDMETKGSLCVCMDERKCGLGRRCPVAFTKRLAAHFWVKVRKIVSVMNLFQ